jgi:hypothetical protein
MGENAARGRSASCPEGRGRRFRIREFLSLLDRYAATDGSPARAMASSASE